ncbi:VWFA and cache domain-containing protein 1 [Nasonia vitripennis]|uniref:VWFA and cache domain-containing protein 1 n=1 Tax=Nasonia vitripennis TaxID=7425 RepID=A0A7M7G4L9_NASVI|nr:VWFA and cache domain-containing protein 1 [Nasonia vitripennis]
MTSYLVLCVAVLAIMSGCTAVMDEKLSNTVPKCQFGKSPRRQIDVMPLNGVCLRDMVVHLSKNLHKLTDDELGVSKFQGMLDKLEFVDSITTLNSRLNDLSKGFNDKLKRYTDLLRDSNSVIQPILLKQGQDIYSTSQRSDNSNRAADVCSKITDALAMNLRNKDWKSLHILPVSQPGTMCGPPSLAHNIGPLLLSQCNRSKNVMLLLEQSSEFMSEEDVTLAQITAKTIVHMLTESDRVSVVGLAAGGSALCPEQGLSHVTDVHKIRLDRHVDSLVRSTVNQSFTLDLRPLVKEAKGDLVLIHLTNNMKDLSNVKGIAEGLKRDNLTVHQRTILILSNQQPRVNVKEFSANGTVITLPTQHVLGYEIARLFAGLKCNKEDVKPYYLSEPYFEPYSKAMMLSVGQITNTALLSFDVKLRDFVEDITYFEAGAHQVRALLVDKRGTLWMHKNFPRMETIVEQPLKVYLHDLENLDEKTMIRTGMADQPEGMVEVKSQLGIKKQLHWRHLTYPDLIVCLVVSRLDEDATRQPLVRSPPTLPSGILHHRLDLALGANVRRDSLCTYNSNRIATLDAGVVYLSPWCFKSPAEQAKQLAAAPAVTVQSYMAYIKDLTRLLTNPGMQESVKADVAVLAQILEHFKERHSQSPLHKFIVQRYVTSVNSGVLELYPGLVLDSDLDPKRRVWYVKALEQPGRLVLSPPYLDAGGSGFVVSLSQVVHEGRSVGLHTSTDPVVAVMAMDVTMGYLSRMLNDMFPLCAETNVKCFLMDDKGYLVFHPSLLKAASKVENQHLTNKELLVANDILNHEFFVNKKMCASHMDGTTQRYYQFNISLDEVLTNIVHGEHCVKYQLAVVPGTNVFLGVVNITCSSISAFCPCSTMDRSCLNCKRMEQTDCECPCECSLYSSECQLREDSASAEMEPCPAPQEQGSSLTSPWIQTVNALKSCQPFSCKAFATKAECLGLVGCQWCEIDSDAETQLQEPFCSDVAVCFKGTFGSPIPYGDGAYNSQSPEEIMSREWPSVGPVAGGILAFVLVLGVALFCYRLRSVHTGLEHQCLHNHNSPDTLRMTHLDCDLEPADLEREPKPSMDSALLRDVIAPISPYRVSTNYRRPPGGDSDHGYSTMTPHDDSEQQNFSEPLLVLAGNSKDICGVVPSTSTATLDSPATSTSTTGTIVAPPSPTTNLGSPHRVIAAVDVHRDMDTNYC